MLGGFRKRRLRGELLRSFEGVIPAPDVAESHEVASQEHQTPATEGPEVYRLDDDEPWSVRDDGLADRLGARSNHAAENRVKRDLKKHDPELFARVEFDSEADTFFAYLESEHDANALRDFLLDMK